MNTAERFPTTVARENVEKMKELSSRLRSDGKYADADFTGAIYLHWRDDRYNYEQSLPGPVQSPAFAPLQGQEISWGDFTTRPYVASSAWQFTVPDSAPLDKYGYMTVYEYAGATALRLLGITNGPNTVRTGGQQATLSFAAVKRGELRGLLVDGQFIPGTAFSVYTEIFKPEDGINYASRFECIWP